jgi:hypothetical protein
MEVNFSAHFKMQSKQVLLCLFGFCILTVWTEAAMPKDTASSIVSDNE